MTRYMKVESVQNIFQRTTLTTEEHNDILSTLTFSDNCPVHGVHLLKTIPAVREAIEQKQWKLAEEQISVIASVLKEETSII